MDTDEQEVVRQRMCKSKRAYDTLKDAKTMKNYLEKKRFKKGTLRSYSCPICEKWHLTHTPLD